MSDDWQTRLADLIKKIERARTHVGVYSAERPPPSEVTIVLVAASDLSGRLRGGANNGEEQ